MRTPPLLIFLKGWRIKENNKKKKYYLLENMTALALSKGWLNVFFMNNNKL
jgi:hypothetical protein